MAAKFTNQQDFINSVLLEFARNVIEQRRKNVRQEQAVASEKLLRSYDYEIRKASIQQVGSALLAFEEHGRFLDMRRLDRKTNQLPVDEVIDWLENGGLEKFQKLDQDAQGRTAANHRPLLNDLAWGIVRNIKKKGRHKKKRRNLQRGFEQQLQVLISELREGYLDRTVEEIKASLKNRLS